MGRSFRFPGAKLRLALAALTCVLAGCLPGDTRPVPEKLLVTAEPSRALQEGFETDDGWRVSFGRFVVGIGHVDFEEDDEACNSYAEARYDRIIDFKVARREKLGEIFGLGKCRVEFRLRSPSPEALLGPGATESDKTRMRTRASDRFVEDRGASVVAIGEATRGGTTKRFSWTFRKSYEHTDCEAEGEFATTVALSEAGEGELHVEVHAEELFRALPDDGAPRVFSPVADADADGDGEVTLDELSEAPGPADLPPEPREREEPAPAAEGTELPRPSLERLVYGHLLPRMLRVEGSGPCEVEERGGWR